MSSSSSFFSGSNATPTEYQTGVNLVAQATQQAAAALASQNAAATSAQAAQGYSVSAGTSATTATNQASSASTSATSASNSASAAATSASNAASSASSASTSATNASNSASAASTSATNASNSASAAATSATNASNSASAAATSASNAASTLSSALTKSDNLASLTNAATARTNLGLTSLATTTPGTGVTTALGVNVGSAGAFVTNGGALGTPSSGNLANCTFPTLNQNTTGTASNITGTLAVAQGGSGATATTGSGSNVLATSPTLVTPVLGTPTSVTLTNATGLPLTTGVTGTLPVANGGTGTSTAFTAGSVVFAGASGVYSQNNSKLFWDNTNSRLGVGFSTPAYTFDIIGADLAAATGSTSLLGRYFSQTGNGESLQILYSRTASSPTNWTTANLILRREVSGTIQQALQFNGDASTTFNSGANELFRITSSGNVGIGTSPAVGLSVLRPVDTTFSPNVFNFRLWGASSATSGNSGSGISFGGYTTGTTTLTDLAFISGIKANATDGNYDGALVFGVRTNASGGGSFERMRIDSSGNVSINTNSALGRLSVYSVGTPTLTGSMTVGSSFIGQSASSLNVGASDSGAWLNAAYANNAGVALPMLFMTAGTERMRITSNGRVGINCSPSYILDIDTGMSYPRIFGSGADIIYRYECTATGGRTYHVGSTGSASGAGNGFTVYDITASAPRFVINPDGKVLIGTTTAGASKLTVADDSIQINTAKTPASATATGTTGQVCWDASYIYVCTATNTWKRAAIATW